ncbi:PIN domain-containing protein [Spirillospora sp. NPDC029432]|uniref:PIN domain-containing protein n=1 Tax=Spirillospora sp. NPDC029432 TaxID=3154599 RepID=UPI0034561174
MKPSSRSGGLDGYTLDAGALIALERRSPRMLRLLDQARQGKAEISIPRSVIAQVWRGGPKQAHLSRLLYAAGTPHPRVAIDELTADRARQIGRTIGESGHCDIVDVHVALLARERGHVIITSDRGDIGKVDPMLPLLQI